MKGLILKSAAVLLLAGLSMPAQAGEVAIYTGDTSWFADKATADAQAQICVDALSGMGISYTWYASTADNDALADWVDTHTDNGDLDVLILYGLIPTTIYKEGNAEPDGSLAELFIESTDGDAIMNHGDWMFYVNKVANNGGAGLQNMMDIPAITMSGYDNLVVTPTAQGLAIAPSLSTWTIQQTDRPLWVRRLAGDWFVEASLAQAQTAGALADPVIVRDGNRGRLIPAFQAASQDDPKGAVAAEIIDYLMGRLPDHLGLSGPGTTVTGTPIRLTIRLLDFAEAMAPDVGDVVVDLSSDSGTGAFDTVWTGDYDGTVTSITIPAGYESATVYYMDTDATVANLTASATNLVGAALTVNVFEDLTGTQGEVAIYTGDVGWIDKAAADSEAQICLDKLDLVGVTNEWFDDTSQQGDLAAWLTPRIADGKVDVLVLYGYFPGTIYPGGNTQPDGSLAEQFIESTDGNMIINHADWIFYVSSTFNNPAGLQNMMDIPGIALWDWDDSPMMVTDQGKKATPSVSTFSSDRPLSIDQLAGNWFVEAAFAQNTAGNRADPVVVRDGNLGRLCVAFQAANQITDPKGAVAAEIILWAYGYEFQTPYRVGIVGNPVGCAGRPMKLNAQIQDLIMSPVAVEAATDVTLTTTSGTGRFDTARDGDFTSTSLVLTVEAGQSTAQFYYKDTASGTPTLTGASAGLVDGTKGLTLYEKGVLAPPGEVAIYNGLTWWIDKGPADVQAQICVDRLNTIGIPNTWYDLESDQAELADWMQNTATNNGKLDVLVIYGSFPNSIYPQGNTQPDGSIAEAFIESPDGDVIINHGDWMFYYVDGVTNNGTDGLINMMDIPGYSISADNTPMIVTDEGRDIAPALGDFLSDRPFFLDTLAGQWYVEASLAESADGTMADPVIVRDGNAGRLIPVFQASLQDDPKGSVAADIIAWLMGTSTIPRLGLAPHGGTATTVNGTPLKLTVSLLDTATPPSVATTVDLATTSGTGAFDTDFQGAYNGSVTSVTIPAGELSAKVYYMDSAAGAVTLTASAAGRVDATLGVNVLLQDPDVTPGEVVIYTGDVGWIAKADADIQAQICVDALNALGITNTWYANTTDQDAVAAWVDSKTGNKQLDVLILYGFLPSALYTAGNTQPDGSLAELFIETTDGDAIINHADWMFYVSSPVNNEANGLKNIMDNPSMEMWYDNTPVLVTDQGAAIAPSLVDTESDRPIPMAVLIGNWFVEASLAENAAGALADPIIMRDGNLGRLIPVFMAASQPDPKGAVAAEIIDWLFQGGEPETKFIRGDTDGNGVYTIGDGVQILERIFANRPAFTSDCEDTGDLDDNGLFTIGDAVWLFNYIFAEGDLKKPPYPPADACGVDPTPETTLGCNSVPDACK
ncbi:MAG: hypothetical protein JXP34_21095 [Planctomycetes bacterium]|nr:hypothetical protein [Planctomycetota bacterium]